MAQKEGIEFFVVSAKTYENILNMFYNVVAELLTFSENNDNKENLIKELIQENGIESAEGIKQYGEGLGGQQEADKKLNANGEQKQVVPSNAKKKKCRCWINR